MMTSCLSAGSSPTHMSPLTKQRGGPLLSHPTGQAAGSGSILATSSGGFYRPIGPYQLLGLSEIYEIFHFHPENGVFSTLVTLTSSEPDAQRHICLGSSAGPPTTPLKENCYAKACRPQGWGCPQKSSLPASTVSITILRPPHHCPRRNQTCSGMAE